MLQLLKRFAAPSAIALVILCSAAGKTLAQSANDNDKATQLPPEGTVRVYKLRLKHDVPMTTKKAPARDSAPAGAHLTYYGGRVVGSPFVIQVLWGNGSYLPEVSGTGTPSMASFYEQLLTSSYTNWLDSEYNTTNQVGGGTNQHIGNGRITAQITITPSVTSLTVSDTQIQAELKSQILDGHLPAPETDVDGNPTTIYAVFFPPGITITQGGSTSCVAGGFCAYHGTVADDTLGEFFYGVHPDMQAGSGCFTGCGNSTTFGNYTSVASHELTETITDAEVGIATTVGPPLAWYDANNGEIGDICNAQQGTFVGADGQTYVLQQEFSNAQNNCIIPPITFGGNNSDFGISASPASVYIAQGGSGSSTISTAAVGVPGTVSLSAAVGPAGPTVSLSPTSIAAGDSSTLSVNADSSVAPGTYTVTVTGTEGTIAHSTAVSVTVVSNNIVNGGFETGDLTGWTSSGAATGVSPTPHSGNFAAMLGLKTPTNGDSSISQTFAVTETGESLSFWYQVVCPDTVTFDWATATLTDNTTNTTVVLLPKTCPLGEWTQSASYDLSPNAGHIVTLTLTSHDDNYPGDPTYTLYDDVQLNVPPNDFSLSASPNSLSITSGGSGASTISTAVTAGTAATVSLALTGLPAGATGSLSPTSVTAGGSSTLTVNTGTAAPGNYTLTITGTESPSTTHSTTVTLTVTAPVANDFSISASPNSLSLNSGGSGASTISTAVVSGSAGTVSLALTGLPAGATASLSPTPVTAGGSSTLTVNAGTAVPGNYALTITGAEGTNTHSIVVTLTVTATVANDFSISASPNSLSLNSGGSGTSTISTAVTAGTAGTVSLTLTGLPAGATGSLSPTSVMAGASSTLTVNAGSAPAGNYTVVVTGTEGTTTHSTSVSVTVTVNQETTTTNVASSVNPSYLNQTVTFTATVTSQFGGAVTGTVTLMQGRAVLCTVALVGNQAACSRTYTTAAVRSITAIYSGDSNNLGSTSPVLKQVVKGLPAKTTTTVTTSGSPGFIGQSVTFTSTTTSTDGLIPDGETVTFYDGASVIGDGATSGGVATLTTSALSARSHTITARYLGDATFNISSGTVTQVVQLYPSVTAVTSSPNPSIYGQAVGLTAVVTSDAPGGPTGNVTFKNGSNVLGTATLSGGTASLTGKLPAGTLTITANYHGDGQSAKSTASTSQTVVQSPTTTTVTSSRNPSITGQTVKLTAIVTSSTTTPNGSVSFMDGATTLATVDLFGGRATYSTSTLTTGPHDVTVVYNGTANFTASTSPILVQVVN